jgi:hypothetical protein
MIVSGLVGFRNFIYVAKAFTAVATLHSNFADFYASALWHFIKVFCVLDDGHVPMVVTLELKLLQKVSSIV